jgi:hypothetical protein
MALIYEPKSPMTRSPIVNKGFERKTEKREGVNVQKTKEVDKGKKPVLRRGEFNE